MKRPSYHSPLTENRPSNLSTPQPCIVPCLNWPKYIPPEKTSFPNPYSSPALFTLPTYSYESSVIEDGKGFSFMDCVFASSSSNSCLLLGERPYTNCCFSSSSARF